VVARYHPGLPEQTDVVVLGLGPGGEHVAGRLAEAGLDVVAVDGGLVGGECPYWGCIPSKMMVRAADLLAEAGRVGSMAGSATVVSDWSPVAARIRNEATDNWDDKVAVERLTAKGARFVRGTGRLDGPGRVIVGDLELEASTGVVVDTGCRPWAPPIDGLEALPYWTNREAIETTSVPASLVVLGGGAICVELAQVFARFGAHVTVVEANDRLISLEEPEAGELLADVFDREHIKVLTGAKVLSASHDGALFKLELDGMAPVVGERLLVATGRRPDLSAIGAATVGIDEEATAIPTDGSMRAGERLWAIGDVTGKGAFTHMSMYQAGICEAQARDAGLRVSTGFKKLPESARGWIHKVGNDGFIKIVEDSDRGVLVGATSVGPSGGEVLGLLALAVHAEVPTDRLRHMIYAYPTFHLAIEAALQDLSD